MRQWIKWVTGFLALSVIMVMIGAVFSKLDEKKGNGGISPVAATEVDRPVTVVIDAGHGGEDGGCIGADGTLEKDLNLAVAAELCDILQASGINAVLIRDEDKMLYDMYGDLESYEGQKKTYDLRNRVRFAEESGCRLFCSIHMNKFADTKYSGLQVYCSVNDSDSITAGVRIQSYVKNYLQPDNNRQIKRAGSEIYVLNRAQMPAVLVECGFLSNSEELSLLNDGEYRKKLAFCIAAGIADSLCNFRT